MKIFKTLGISLFLALVLLGVGTQSAEAADFVGDEEYTLPAGDTLNDDLYVSGANVLIEGDINGDLFAAGQTVTVNGKVDGNVFTGGGTVTINGDITGDLFASGGSIVFTGTADDARMVGGQISILGDLVGDLMVAGGTIKLDGLIGGDAYIGTEVLNIEEGAKIVGDLSYATPDSDSQAERATEGSVEFFEDESVAPTTGSLIGSWFVKTVLAIVGYVLLTWLLIRYLPGFLPRHDVMLNNDLGKSAGWGIIGFFVLPFVIFISTIIMGILFGFGGAMAVALTGFSGLALIYLLSPIVVAHWLGTQFTDMGMTGILVAVAVAAILITLPLVGGIFAFISYVLALGSGLIIGRSNNGSSNYNDPIDPIKSPPAAA